MYNVTLQRVFYPFTTHQEMKWGHLLIILTKQWGTCYFLKGQGYMTHQFAKAMEYLLFNEGERLSGSFLKLPRVFALTLSLVHLSIHDIISNLKLIKWLNSCRNKYKIPSISCILEAKLNYQRILQGRLDYQIISSIFFNTRT